jgi:hypothetical protein
MNFRPICVLAGVVIVAIFSDTIVGYAQPTSQNTFASTYHSGESIL